MPTPLSVLRFVHKWWWGKVLNLLLGSPETLHYESRTAPTYEPKESTIRS